MQRVTDVLAGIHLLHAWWVEARKPGKLTVWLSGELCRLSLVPALDGARDRADAESAVQGWLASQGSLPAGTVARLANWPGKGASWRVATVQQQLLNVLDEQFGRSLGSVRPWWSWALHQSRDQGTAQSACAFDGVAATICQWGIDDEVVLADTVSPIHDESSLRRLLLRRQSQAGMNEIVCASLRWPALTSDRAVEIACTSNVDASSFAFAGWVEHGQQS